MDEKRLEEIERAHELGEPWAPTHDLCLGEDEDMRELVAEVRALTALLEATYLPLSIRELRRTEGTAAAAREWRAKSDAFLEGLQKERDEAWAEVRRLRSMAPLVLPRSAVFDASLLESGCVVIADMPGRELRRAERERCAKVADAYAKRAWAAMHVSEPAAVAAEHLAGEIRALPDES